MTMTHHNVLFYKCLLFHNSICIFQDHDVPTQKNVFRPRRKLSEIDFYIQEAQTFTDSKKPLQAHMYRV